MPSRTIMAKVTHLQEFGDQFKLIYDDGTSALAYQTLAGIWIVGASGDTPGPGPGPGDAKFVWPAPVSSLNINNGYPEDGFRTAGRPNHEGVDFGFGAAVAPGALNKSSGAGRVVTAEWFGGYGLGVIVDHGSYDGKNYKTLYGHNDELRVSAGQNVALGQGLGTVGNTGNSFGKHIHWEVWENDVKIDPVLFMRRVNPGNAVAP